MQQKRLLETVKTAFVGDEYGIRQPRRRPFPCLKMVFHMLKDRLLPLLLPKNRTISISFGDKKNSPYCPHFSILTEMSYILILTQCLHFGELHCFLIHHFLCRQFYFRLRIVMKRCDFLSFSLLMTNFSINFVNQKTNLI